MTKAVYEITAQEKPGGWLDGTIGGFRFQAKIFDEGSEFGIKGGRVSKLCIWHEATRQNLQNIFAASIVNYDRGWDIRPKGANEQRIFAALVDYLEALPTAEPEAGAYGTVQRGDGKMVRVYIPGKSEDE